MSRANAQSVASVFLATVIGFNCASVVVNVAVRNYGVAVFTSVVVVALTAWQQLRPKFDGWIEARFREALARQRMAETALAAMEEAKRLGSLQISVERDSVTTVN